MKLFKNDFNRPVVVYKGDDMRCEGTVAYCAEVMGVTPETVIWYCSDTYTRRLEKRKVIENATTVVRLDEDE